MGCQAAEHVVLNVNGTLREMRVKPSRTLLEVLREDLDLTGAKLACDNGECGSCIVLLGRRPAKACLLAVNRAQGKVITTIEGLAAPPAAPSDSGDSAWAAYHPLQQAFLEKGATQCGFCIPGMIMRASALLIKDNYPTRAEVVKSLSLNMCRCTGYMKIIDAVLDAAERLRSNTPSEAPPTDKGPVVGQSVPRLDSPDTVTGAAKYAADLKMDGMLHAKLLRSPHHHARIRSIDTSEAKALPGVAAVITADDVPGTPFLPNCQPQVYVFPKDKVRFLGEAVAAVAADTVDTADSALARIKVDYEPLPPVVDLMDAAREEAPRIFDHLPNLWGPEEVVQGDVDAGFATADIVVERTYSVPMREHAAMEPEAALAYEDGDGKIIIKTPLYHPFVQGQLSIAANLDVSPDRVRIVCPVMGGNFGTRGDTLAAVVVALLARITRRPVKNVFTRAESLLGSCKAPPVIMKYKTGATKDGRLVALDAEIIHGTGSWAPFLIPTTTKGVELCFYETLGALLSHATGPYDIPNVRARAYDVLTNAPRCVPLRGTNGNYLPLAYESQIELLAAELGRDPLDLRLRNVLEVGSRTHVGQVLEESVGIKAELEALRPFYDQARERVVAKRGASQSPWKRGLGIACGWRNIGYLNTKIGAGAELLEDGRVRVLAGSVEQGQGPTTVFAQIACDELGIPMESLKVTIGDTYTAPYPVPTFSSITTVGTGKAVQLACERLKLALHRAAATILGVAPESIVIGNGAAHSQRSPADKLSLARLAAHFGENDIPMKYEASLEWQGESPNILYGYNAGLVELEVNEVTGQVKLLDLVNVCDPGTVVHPEALEGQVDGGVAFGIGCALKERFHPDNPPTLAAYGLPMSTDVPHRLVRLFVEEPYSKGPFGAKSAGEMPGISPIPAIVNAIEDATGARIYDVPATPEKVLAALEAQR